jgi:tRNA threonylcarbamoyladenosine biosynthesis protein TsaE
METNQTEFLEDESATAEFGGRLARAIVAGVKIELQGDLGVGKSSLVRALLRAKGYGGSVKSPTYSLVESYVIEGVFFHHFDFYRFVSEEEFMEAGLDEYFSGSAVCLVEWPEKAGQYLPRADLRITLSYQGEGRMLQVDALSSLGEEICRNVV